MKIAYLINTYPQASQSFIRREIAALEGLGVPIERFTVRRWTTPLVDEGDRAEERRTRCLLEAGSGRLLLATLGVLWQRPGRWFAALGTALRLGVRSHKGMVYQMIYFMEACLLAQWLETGGIDHVHAHFGSNATMVALLCRRLGGPPFSFTVHGPEEFDRPRGLKLAEKIAAAQWVVAVSEFGRSQLFRWCAAEDWDKIHVVHCGVDQSFLAATEGPCRAARLVCVGRLCEQKGQLLLVRAAGVLAQRNIDFQLRLVGDGPLRRDIEAMIAQLGLQQKVQLCGWLSNAQVRQEIAAAQGAGAAELCRGVAGGVDGGAGAASAGDQHLRGGDSGVGGTGGLRLPDGTGKFTFVGRRDAAHVGRRASGIAAHGGSWGKAGGAGIRFGPAGAAAG